MDELEFAISTLQQYPIFRVSLTLIKNVNREYFKPLGGKLLRRYPKEWQRCKKQGHLPIGGAFICRNMIG